MPKRFIIFALFFLSFVPMAFGSSRDFSTMSPTVKVTSHKALFTENVMAYGSGSGTALSADGLIVTNHHVIFDETENKPLDAFEICITFDLKEEPVCEFTARLIAHDKDLDIALLKMDSTDVFGNPVDGLKFMTPSSATPKEQDKVQIIGYPASGGETITVTQGQISGSETYNGHHYFKTDTDFDHGSSGGTAIDSNGNYIGIPTYIRSYAENVGYFLDLREAKNWIEESRGKAPLKNSKAESLLKKELARLATANKVLTYRQDLYPYASATLPKDWKFEEITNDSFYASQKNVDKPVSVSVVATNYQYNVDQAYLDKMDEELEKLKKSYSDFKKETVTFAGQSCWKVTFTNYSSRNTIYYIPFGYSMTTFSYAIDLNETEEQEKAVRPILDSFRFDGSPKTEPLLPPTLDYADPAFSISMPEGWRIQRNVGKDSPDLLAEAVQQGNFDGSFAVYYSTVPKDERELTPKELLDDKIKKLGSDKLVFKNDSVVLGGLEGSLITTEYEGSDYQKMKKRMTVELRDGDYKFTIDYDDLAEHFDANLADLKAMLDSFEFRGKTTKDKSLHEYGDLGFTFTDIQFHPYAQAISVLAEKGILSGDANGEFHPEDTMSRAEALRWTLESKNKIEKDRNSKKAVDFAHYKPKAKLSFKDVKANSPSAPYIRYAVDKKWVSVPKTKAFRPDAPINLAEALKIVLGIYEIPLWKGDTNPWFKKFTDKGFELGLIPRGLNRKDAGEILTRAEFANLIHSIYRQADSSFSMGY